MGPETKKDSPEQAGTIITITVPSQDVDNVINAVGVLNQSLGDKGFQIGSIKRANPEHLQVEQVSLDLLKRIFEVDAAQVRHDELSYSVNCDTTRVLLERISEKDAISRKDPTLRFLIRAEDANGAKSWRVDEAGEVTPYTAKLRSSSVANAYDMSHLSAVTLIGYITEKLNIKV